MYALYYPLVRGPWAGVRVRVRVRVRVTGLGKALTLAPALPLPAPTALAAVREAAAKPSRLRSCESARPLTWAGLGLGVRSGLKWGSG